MVILTPAKIIKITTIIAPTLTLNQPIAIKTRLKGTSRARLTLKGIFIIREIISITIKNIIPVIVGFPKTS